MRGRWFFLLLAVVAVAGLGTAAAARWLGDDDDGAKVRTAFARSDSSRSATVWAVGDAADGGRPGKRVARMIARARPDRFLYLGDVYEEGTPEEFERNYDPIYGDLKDITAPTPGNHEWPNHEEGYDEYWGAVGHPSDHWYRFETAGWEILSLNSEEAHGPGSPQVRWLKRQVREPGTCRIAFWHRPFVSAGRHGDQEDVAPLWRAVRGRVAIVLSGNDHNMQRFRRRDGIVQFVSGAGGRELYESDEDDPRLAWDEDDEFGALRLDLRRGVARFRFVAVGKGTLHHGRIRCRPLSG
jgi:hypothetical protein